MDYTLIGYTGFVGSNIEQRAEITKKYNSENITEAFDKNHDIIIYSGVRAEKYLANTEPEKDMDIVQNAIENITRLNFKKLVLISTVDVYKYPEGVNENTAVDTKGLHAYGFNRYYLEQWVTKNISDYHIVRLPGLFGKNLKKNFIFDMINIIPSMLKENIYENILKDNKELYKYYVKNNSFYKLKPISIDERMRLKEFFSEYKFNALYFTDSRNNYQFYNLANLWNDIQHCIKHDIKLLNIATEPINTADLYNYITGKNFTNITSNEPVMYNMESIYAKKYYNHEKYLYLKGDILKEIKAFIEEHR